METMYDHNFYGSATTVTIPFGWTHFHAKLYLVYNTNLLISLFLRNISAEKYDLKVICHYYVVFLHYLLKQLS